MNKKGISTALIYIFIILIVLLPELSVMFEDASLPAWLTNDYARIVEMDYKAVLVDEPDSQGKIVVTERMTFDIHAASRSNGFWELWRDLCEDTIDGVKVHYKVNSVKLITSSGEEIPWEESDKLYWDDYDYVSSNSRYGPGKWYHSEGPYNESRRRYECVFFYVDDIYREKMTFEIEYEMYNAALRYGDCSDLYIAMYSGDTTRYLESFNAEILIPNKDMPKEGNYEYTTYGTNANNFDISESSTKNPGYHTFYFSLDEEDLQFRPYNEYIEFDLISYGDDKHIFTDYASKNIYYDDPALEEIRAEQADYANEPAKYVAKKITGLVVCLVLATLIMAFGRIKIAKLNKKYPSSANDKDIPVFRDIPSDLDPKFAAALVACKEKKPEDDSAVYAALLLSLARKKYLTIDEMDYGGLTITLNEPEEEESVGVFTYPTLSSELRPGQVMGPYGPYTPAKNFEPRYVQDPDDMPSPSLSDYLQSRQPSVMNNVSGGNQMNSNIPVSAFERKGYVTVSDDEWNATSNNDWGMQHVAESVVEEQKEPLTPAEEHYYKLIKRLATRNRISMATLQNLVETDYDNTRNFAKKIEKVVIDVGVGQGYFQKVDYQSPKKQLSAIAKVSIVGGIIALAANILSYHTRFDLMFGGLFVLGIACIANGLYLNKNSHKYVLLTSHGEAEYQKWRGLYNFLNSDTLIKEREVVELPLWEKYLVYATAFDISEKVIAAIKIHCPEISEESIATKPVYRSRRIYASGRSFHSSVRSAVHRSSSSGGGGYGGGGRGGGGGGGGH